MSGTYYEPGYIDPDYYTGDDVFGAFQFVGASKLIVVQAGVTSISVRELVSRWADWVALDDNSKFLQAFATLGGESIDPSAGTFVPVYAFFLNGWRLRPQEANHTLNVGDGILLVSGGGDPFVNTLGSFVVRINYQQPVQAISFATGGGGGGGASAADVWNYPNRTVTNLPEPPTVPTAADNAEAVWTDPRALTVPKFLGLK